MRRPASSMFGVCSMQSRICCRAGEARQRLSSAVIIYYNRIESNRIESNRIESNRKAEHQSLRLEEDLSDCNPISPFFFPQVRRDYPRQRRRSPGYHALHDEWRVHVRSIRGYHGDAANPNGCRQRQLAAEDGDLEPIHGSSRITPGSPSENSGVISVSVADTQGL